MNDIDLTGLNTADVLAALYNASQPLGLGFLNPASNRPLTSAQAQQILDDNPHRYFDYLNGRVMKVDLNGDHLDPWLYDRDNGTGAAARAIAALRTQYAA